MKLKKKKVLSKNNINIPYQTILPKTRSSTVFRPLVLSRHPSHNILRTNLPKLPFRSVIRLGSTTVKNDFNRIEINSIQSIKNSANKLLMKRCFDKTNISHADWYIYTTNGFRKESVEPQGLINIDLLPYPIIAKHIFGSRGTGNSMINNPNEMKAFISNKDIKNYIFEKYYNYNKEYRLHVSENGCFYACRKMLKRDTPKNERFQRHNDNSVWLLENNKDFDKPSNWDDIVKNCVKALKALSGDIMGFDVKVQNELTKEGKKRKKIEYIIIESNSACSFGTITAERYLQEIPRILNKKNANK